LERQQVRAHRGLFHACSPEVGDEVIKWYDADPARVVALPWGVDLDHFRPDAEGRGATRAAWGAGSGDRVLLLVANEFARKGLATILGALALQGRPDVRLVVIGRDDPAPYRTQIARLGLADRVMFAGSQDPAPAYQAADLFVMPSSYEGWGLVLAEALACGLPAVVSRFPGSVAMVAPRVNGLLLESSRDEAELAALLDEALEPFAHAAMAAAARPSVTHYGWPEVGRTLVELGLRAACERR
jgi:glycosyltransferase involved in cell wall biosynthesis